MNSNQLKSEAQKSELKRNSLFFNPLRFLYLILGILCLILAVIGAFLPLLPTVPFLILAAYCFKRSSHWFYNLLISIPAFGSAINEWEKYKLIRTKYKIISISALSLSMGWVIIFRPLSLILKIIIALCWLALVSYIGSRKGHRDDPPKN